jgi:hypothetical protein
MDGLTCLSLRSLKLNPNIVIAAHNLRILRPLEQPCDLVVQWTQVRGPMPLPITNHHKYVSVIPACVDTVRDNAAFNVWVPFRLGVLEYVGKWIGHGAIPYLYKTKFICT